MLLYDVFLSYHAFHNARRAIILYVSFGIVVRPEIGYSKLEQYFLDRINVANVMH